MNASRNATACDSLGCKPQDGKERPILFSGPMVRAILAGRKTQTRRIVKLQPGNYPGLGADGFYVYAKCGMNLGPLKCPYGKVGDCLWVRETWTPDHADFYPHFPIVYRADFLDYERENGMVWSSEQSDWFPFRWRPAIHMPRRVCRITLEITGVRIQPLHHITNRDIIAEGFEAIGPETPLPGTGLLTQAGRFEGKFSTLRQLFSDKWTEINGPGSWSANPWVWVIEFRRVA